jgi:malonate-semialdehyde dehydrogenase (acetylating)/methylmalonate-semialdehyde dehydrogenase
MAISVAVAVGDAADPLVDALSAKARALKVAPSFEDGADMGPVVTRDHRNRIAGYIDAGVSAGAALVVDGRGLTIPGHEQGFFLGPTLFDHVTPEMTIYQDEIFGPVLIVVRVGSLEEAVALINRNPYGNGTALFTRSGAAARLFEQEVQVGMVGINVPIPVPMAFYSFGGWRNSLFGDLHVHGMDGVRFYTRGKAVTTRWPDDGSAAPGFHLPTLG